MYSALFVVILVISKDNVFDGTYEKQCTIQPLEVCKK